MTSRCAWCGAPATTYVEPGNTHYGVPVRWFVCDEHKTLHQPELFNSDNTPNPEQLSLEAE